MADTTGLPPEGWYPDRPNATRLRHWSGAGWTNEFRPISPPVPTPEPVAQELTVALAPASPVRETTDQARSRRELRAQVGALVQGEPDTPARGVPAVVSEPVAKPISQPTPEPATGTALTSADRARAAAGYPPARQQAWQDSFAATAPTGSSQTFAGWLYAASPLWLGALIVAGMTLLSIVNPQLVQAGLGIVGFAMTFLLARQDVRHLTQRGYRAPSLWWVLLPFFYFVVRMVRVGVRGVAMVITYLLSAVAVVALLYLAFVGNPALLATLAPSVPAETSAIPTPVTALSAQERASILTEDGTEAQLRLELSETWTDIGSVDCVGFTSNEPGTTTTCVVELDGVPYSAGLEITPDEPGAAFLLTGMIPVEN
jgi:hypothetical protein